MSGDKSLVELFWFDGIDEEFIKQIIPCIAEVHDDNEKTEIVLWINSAGGHVECAVTFLDFIKAKRVNLTTIGLGRVDSAAILVWASGKFRAATRNCRFLFHKPGQIIAGEETGELAVSEIDCLDMAQGLRVANKRLCSLLARQLKIKTSVVLSLVEQDNWITAQEAKRLGMLHRII